MKKVTSLFIQKNIIPICFCVFSIFIFTTSNANAVPLSLEEDQTIAKLPDHLQTTYTGTLAKESRRTSVNTNGTCTIKRKGYRTYSFYFSDGVAPIKGVKFVKNDDTYTASHIYKGKTLGISLDEDGDLSIGSTGRGSIAFNGSIEGYHDHDDEVSHQGGSTGVVLGTGDTGIQIDDSGVNLGTGGSGVHVGNGGAVVGTEDAGVHVDGGRTVVGTEDAGILIEDGNINIGTRDAGIRIGSGGIRIGTDEEVVVIEDHSDTHISSGVSCFHRGRRNYIYCGSSEVSYLPKKAVGVYIGDLETDYVDTKKGICTIVPTGCKTYRLDFSNNLPSIHGVQFAKPNNFNEYTSVVIEGEYSSAIEIDMSFNDLKVDGEVLGLEFDGDKR